MLSDSRCHIFFLIPNLSGGGAERVIVTLLRHLDRAKFKLTLATVNIEGAVYHEDVPDDVTFIDLHCTRVRYALSKIVRLIWQQKPNIVFSSLGHLNLALAIIRPILPNVCYIAREGSIVSENIQGRWWKLAYRLFYSRFDTVVCQSNFMQEDLVSNFSVPHKKTIIINNPVDQERITQLVAKPLPIGFERVLKENTGPPIHLVAAGRLSREKGFDLLIAAIAMCKSSRLHLTILGDGPLRSDLEQLAIEKEVAQQVRFAGFQKNPFPFFAQADAFVLSSRYEGFPNVVLEALAAGIPVIATPAPGGTREILDGMEGCVVAEDVTAAGLAKAIKNMCFGKLKPQFKIDCYSIPTIINKYSHLFETSVKTIRNGCI